MPKYPHDELLEHAGDAQQRSLEHYEQKLVQKLLTEFKLTRQQPLLLERYRERTGVPQLSLDVFYEFFRPPIYLVAERFGYLFENNTVAQLFSTFAKRTFSKRYLEILEDYSDAEVPIGMAFAWPQLPGGLILHNGTRDTDYDGVFMCWRSGDLWCVLEPWSVFLHNLRQQWTPEL